MGQTISGLAMHHQESAGAIVNLDPIKLAGLVFGDKMCHLSGDMDLDDCELALSRDPANRIGLLTIDNRTLMIGQSCFDHLSGKPQIQLDRLSKALSLVSAAYFFIDDATNTGVIASLLGRSFMIFDSTDGGLDAASNPVDAVLNKTASILGTDAISFSWLSEEWVLLSSRQKR
ncbi:MAG: hypothetical protein AAGD07_25610 [Planctomycetota bacterium]